MKTAQWIIMFLLLIGHHAIYSGAEQPEEHHDLELWKDTRWTPSPAQKIAPSAIATGTFVGGFPGVGAAVYASRPHQHWLTLGQILAAKKEQSALQSEQSKNSSTEQPAMEARFAFDNYEIQLLKKLQPFFAPNPKNKINYQELLAFEKIVDQALDRVDSLLESGAEYNATAYDSIIQYHSRTNNKYIKALINYLNTYIRKKISFNPAQFSNPLFFSSKTRSFVRFAPQYIIDIECLDRLKDFIHALKHVPRYQKTMTFQPVYTWDELP